MLSYKTATGGFFADGHHRVLPDSGSITNSTDVSSRLERIQRAKQAYASIKTGERNKICHTLFVDRIVCQKNFFTQMLYSCLADTVYPDIESSTTDHPRDLYTKSIDSL